MEQRGRFNFAPYNLPLTPQTRKSILTNMSCTVNEDVEADAFTLEGLSVVGGVNNVFGVNPPVCLACTLNGYDAGTYDLPGAFWNIRLEYEF